MCIYALACVCVFECDRVCECSHLLLCWELKHAEKTSLFLTTLYELFFGGKRNQRVHFHQLDFNVPFITFSDPNFQLTSLNGWSPCGSEFESVFLKVRVNPSETLLRCSSSRLFIGLHRPGGVHRLCQQTERL